MANMKKLNSLDSVISEGDDKLDLETGYFTRKVFTIGSDACEKYEQNVTQLIKDTKREYKGRVWYLTTMTLPGGILFPDGIVDNYKWVVAPIADLDNSEHYPIPNKPGEYYQTRVAVEGAKQFEEFKEGLVYLGMQ